ncbi:hypothetical protein F4782DRAFT_73081 [Xylaria castorea]|nr:hypothetical protein F4782DRAFT_73081 [Xylaria castorea]
MSSTICSNCRLALRRTLRASRASRQQMTAAQSTVVVAASLSRPSRTQPPSSDPIDPTTPPDLLASLLSRPTWSVRSLLPSSDSPTPSQSTTTITSKTLHHLLRLSALPAPQTPKEKSQMLATLSSQLHFVRAIQGVDTAGVAPLRVIRDETAAGLREQTIGLAELREALDAEDVVGHARRPRRRRIQRAVGQESSSSRGGGGDTERRDACQEREQILSEEENWDVLGGATETAGGRYFVVRSSGTAPPQFEEEIYIGNGEVHTTCPPSASLAGYSRVLNTPINLDWPMPSDTCNRPFCFLTP